MVHGGRVKFWTLERFQLRIFHPRNPALRSSFSVGKMQACKFKVFKTQLAGSLFMADSCDNCKAPLNRSGDWCNLEKAKRVKSFCCAEFYDFIEKAEAAGRMPPKKREKYASREDSMEKTYEKLEGSFRPPRSRISKKNDVLDHRQSKDLDSSLLLKNDSQTSSSPTEIQLSRIEERAYRADIGEDHVSGTTEDAETDCSGMVSLESASNEGKNALSDSSAFVELQPKYPRRNDGHGSISSSDDIFPHPSNAATGRGFSKKRQGKWKKSKLPRNSVKRRAAGFIDSGSGVSQDYNEARLSQRNRGYRSFVGSSRLLDVDLRVDGNNYRRNVSMVSTTSKLNGHAIVGHPVVVEPLEAGSMGSLLAIFDRFPSGWRTGRRTANLRVPRPIPGTRSKAPRKVRSLSSITAEAEGGGTKKIVSGDDEYGGKCGSTAAVACIPVNLVFSRLQEELARQLQNQ